MVVVVLFRYKAFQGPSKGKEKDGSGGLILAAAWRSSFSMMPKILISHEFALFVVVLLFRSLGSARGWHDECFVASSRKPIRGTKGSC